MARCTAPREGHRTASGRDACPACGGRSRGYSGYSGYSTSSYQSSPTPSYSSGYSSGSRSSGGSRSVKPRWSRRSSGSGGGSWSGGSSAALYTEAEVRALTPVRENVEKQLAADKQLIAQQLPVPDKRDYFLCHSWDDRKDAAKELCDLLCSNGSTVWFSENDIPLGSSFVREIDKGLAKSRTGIVLVTPAFLRGLPKMGIADRELSALLAQDRLIPIVHNTTYDALRAVSPLLGSRNGLDTAEQTMTEIAAKLAEIAAPEPTAC